MNFQHNKHGDNSLQKLLMEGYGFLNEIKQEKKRSYTYQEIDAMLDDYNDNITLYKKTDDQKYKEGAERIINTLKGG